MRKPYTLAIDQGGQSTRIAVFDAIGNQICCFSSPCTTRHYSPSNSTMNFIEQDSHEILRGIEDCLQKIIAFLGDDIRLITAAGFAGQGSSFLCWNHQTGEPITPVISWQDIRGESLLPHEQLSHQQAQKISGLRVSPHYGASKMRWCLTHDEQVIHAKQNGSLAIGPIVSFVFSRLLAQEKSQIYIDPGHAQRTLLWNMQRNEWDDFLLGLCSIDRNLLPTCAYHNSNFGNLQLGDHLAPVVASARDQGASVFAHGLPRANAIYINMGTGAFIQRISDNMNAPEGLLVAPLWLSKNPQDIALYAWEATVNGAASAIPFIEQHTGVALTPNIIDEVCHLNPEKKCYFLNAVGGLSAPYWRTDLLSEWSENLSPSEKILAWLESILFQIVINVCLMNSEGSANLIYISGGLSNANAMCQHLADLLQMPVHRYDNADATLQGIGFMAASMPENWNKAQKVRIFSPLPNDLLYKRFVSWQTAMEKWLATH